jgi:flagellar FliL protein
MATPAKPGAAAKPGATEEADALPAKKSKKMLIIIIAVVLLIGGGATAYFLMKPAHPPAKNAAKNPADAADAADASKDATTEEAGPEVPPKYVPLGTFTANLIHEEGDRYLQVAISIKISKPELEEKIKAFNPEILHHVNLLLQSKRPSELSTLEGKEKLASDIKTRIEQVLGFRKPEPATSSTQAQSAAASAPETAPETAESQQIKSGIEEVLFTSFIIQ